MRLFSFISTGTINFNDIPQRSNCIVSWNTFIIFIRINILRNVCLSNLNVSRKNVLCVIINKSLKTKLQIQKSYFITLSSILLSAQYLRTIYQTKESIDIDTQDLSFWKKGPELQLYHVKYIFLSKEGSNWNFALKSCHFYGSSVPCFAVKLCMQFSSF